MEEKFNSRETALDLRIFLGTRALKLKFVAIKLKRLGFFKSFIPSCSMLGLDLVFKI